MQRRERILAIAVAALAGCWVFDVAVIGPVSSWYDHVRTEADETARTVAASRALVDRQARIMADWRARHAAGLLDDEATARYRAQQAIASAARSAGFTLESVGGGQLVPALREQSYDLMRFTASGQGGFAQAMAFVGAIEAAAMPLRIERCEVSTNDPRKDAVELALTISTRIVAPAARPGRAVPEGTAAWRPEPADAAITAAVVAAKPFQSDRRGPARLERSDEVVRSAPTGWALVGIVRRDEGAVAFLRNQGDGTERLMRTGDQVDGRTATAIGSAGLTLSGGGGDGTQMIAVGNDLTGAPVQLPNATPAPAAPGATPLSTGGAPPASGLPADADRDAILQRLRQQRNRSQ